MLVCQFPNEVLICKTIYMCYYRKEYVFVNDYVLSHMLQRK